MSDSSKATRDIRHGTVALTAAAGPAVAASAVNRAPRRWMFACGTPGRDRTRAIRRPLYSALAAGVLSLVR
jgi:hypothetical protein